MSLFASIRTSFTLMTAVPLGGGDDLQTSPDVAAFFPWVGWLIGGVAIFGAEAVRAASAVWGSDSVLSTGGYLLGALIVALTALATRFLHWDGLADTADAFWNGGDAARKGEIMSDSATGAFGATAVALIAITQVTAYGAIFSSPARLGFVVFATPIIARCSASLAAWLGQPLRADGLGAHITGKPSVPALVIWLIGVLLPMLIVWRAHEVPGLIWSVVALVCAAVVPHLIARRIGGVSGDAMGAGILLTETIILVVAGLGSTL